MTKESRGLWVAAWLGAALAAGCSPAGGSQDGSVGATPACAWPSSWAGLDAAVSSSGACVAGRAYLSCTAPDGSGEVCLTDDVTGCPEPNATGLHYGTCQNLCNAGEYALACGGPGPGPWPTPPPECRPAFSGPGGGTASCCPCQTSVAN